MRNRFVIRGLLFLFLVFIAQSNVAPVVCTAAQAEQGHSRSDPCTGEPAGAPPRVICGPGQQRRVVI
jgi:hypothetical protein